MIQVSAHAITRYIERVAPVSRAEALAAIMAYQGALDIAARLGTDCRFNHRRKAA